MAGAASAAALTAFVTSATLRKDLPDRSHLVHGLPFLAWQAVREGVTEDRPSMTALALGAGYFLWQVPSLWLNSESWSLYPVLIAVFAAWWGWTGWRAMRR